MWSGIDQAGRRARAMDGMIAGRSGQTGRSRASSKGRGAGPRIAAGILLPVTLTLTWGSG